MYNPKHLANTLRWLLTDQRQLIAAGFDEGDKFSTRLVLPHYYEAHLSSRIKYSVRTVHFFRNPNDFAEVFKAPDARINASSGYAFLKPYLGDESVFVLQGSTHRPAKQNVIRLIRDKMTIENDDIQFFNFSIKSIFKPGTYPVLPEYQKLLSGFVLRTILESHNTNISDEIVSASIQAAENTSGTFLVLPQIIRWTRRFGTGLQIRRQRIALRRFILDRISTADFSSFWGESGAPATGNRQSQLADNLMTLLIAGFETTSVTLSWLSYHLANNDDAQSSLRREIVENLFRSSESGKYLADDTTLLAQCIYETLRLNPAIPFIIREAASPMELAGVQIQTGDYIILSIEELHKAYPGPMGEGSSWIPTRFAQRRDGLQVRSFGGGAKLCPGRAVAVQQMRLIVSAILPFFKFRLSSRTDPRIIRNRVSAAPRRGMVLTLDRLM